MFTPIDIFFVLVILVFALMALAKGFVKELFGKASVIVGIGVAFMFYERLSVYVLPYIKNVLLAKILSFLVIFILAYLVVKIIQHIVANAFSSEIMHGLDKALGLLLGFVEGLTVVTAIIVIMLSQPWINCKEVLGGSFFLKTLGNIVSSQVLYFQGFFA